MEAIKRYIPKEYAKPGCFGVSIHCSFTIISMLTYTRKHVRRTKHFLLLIIKSFHKHPAFTQIQNLQRISFTVGVNILSIKSMLKNLMCNPHYRKVTTHGTHIYLNILFHSLYAVIPHIANKGPPPFSNRACIRKRTIINDLLKKQIYSPIL